MIGMLLSCGWEPASADHWIDSAGDSWHIEPSFNPVCFIQHFASTLRSRLWISAASHQNGKGMDSGADVSVLRKHLKHLESTNELGPYAMLTTVACDGLWPRQRIHDIGRPIEARCPRCRAANETLAHRFWYCPANKKIDHPSIAKSDYLVSEARSYHAKFPCFWLRGVVPGAWLEDPCVKDEPRLRRFHIEGIHTFVPSSSSKQAVFTDGSGGKYTKDKRLRRCGWGWIVLSHPREGEFLCHQGGFGTLEGWSQTVPRAELRAAIEAVAGTVGPVDIFTDCGMLVRGAARPMSQWCDGANCDLWLELYTAVSNHRGSVDFIKVKAHDDGTLMRQGRQSPFAFFGNCLVDRLASQGAQQHELPEGWAATVGLVDAKARVVQERLLHISLACTEYNELPGKISVSRSSTRGSFPSLNRARKLGHDLQRISKGKCCCTRCRRPVTKHKLAQFLLEGRCDPVELQSRPATVPLGTTVAAGGLAIHPSHNSVRFRQFFWCWTCGAFAQRKPVLLAEPCRGKKLRAAARHVLRRLRRGETPQKQFVWAEPAPGDLAQFPEAPPDLEE